MLYELFLCISANVVGAAFNRCLTEKWIWVISQVGNINSLRSDSDNSSAVPSADNVYCSERHEDGNVVSLETSTQSDKFIDLNINGNRKRQNVVDNCTDDEHKETNLDASSSDEHISGDVGSCTDDVDGADVKCGLQLDTPENNKEQQVCCRFCGKSFATNPNRPLMALQQHETKFCKRNPWSMTTLEPKPVVSLKYPYSCQYCPHAFTSESRCKKHEASCARRPDYMAGFDMKALMICDICNHMCANELGLAYHKTKTHGCQ